MEKKLTMPKQRSGYGSLRRMAESMAVGDYRDMPDISTARAVQRYLRKFGKCGQVDTKSASGILIWRMA